MKKMERCVGFAVFALLLSIVFAGMFRLDDAVAASDDGVILEACTWEISASQA